MGDIAIPGLSHPNGRVTVRSSHRSRRLSSCALRAPGAIAVRMSAWLRWHRRLSRRAALAEPLGCQIPSSIAPSHPVADGASRPGRKVTNAAQHAAHLGSHRPRHGVDREPDCRCNRRGPPRRSRRGGCRRHARRHHLHVPDVGRGLLRPLGFAASLFERLPRSSPGTRWWRRAARAERAGRRGAGPAMPVRAGVDQVAVGAGPIASEISSSSAVAASSFSAGLVATRLR